MILLRFRNALFTAVSAVLMWLAPVAATAETSPAREFPPRLESYADANLSGLGEVLQHRVQVEPFNLWATLLFIAAVIHTFMTHKFLSWAHVLEERHRRRNPDAAQN